MAEGAAVSPCAAASACACAIVLEVSISLARGAGERGVADAIRSARGVSGALKFKPDCQSTSAGNSWERGIPYR